MLNVSIWCMSLKWSVNGRFHLNPYLLVEDKKFQPNLPVNNIPCPKFCLFVFVLLLLFFVFALFCLFVFFIQLQGYLEKGVELRFWNSDWFLLFQLQHFPKNLNKAFFSFPQGKSSVFSWNCTWCIMMLPTRFNLYPYLNWGGGRGNI